MFCVREKKKTMDLNPRTEQTKNGRLIRKAKCASCGITKTQFLGAGFDIHKTIMPILPKKGLTLPGYRYCGPGNPLDNGPPSNELDAVCEQHDRCYSEEESKRDCDKKMIQNLKNTKSKTVGEKVTKNLLVKPFISAKYKLGWGCSTAPSKQKH